jgi:hypothetical protein
MCYVLGGDELLNVLAVDLVVDLAVHLVHQAPQPDHVLAKVPK